MNLIYMKGVEKCFRANGVETKALKGIDFTVEQGESVAIIGVSGSGKTTLMNIISMLDEKTTGEYKFINEDIDNYSDSQRASLRAKHMGIIFQQLELIESESVKSNIMLGLYIGTKYKMKEFNTVVDKILQVVGISYLKKKKGKYLSGGEKQRVAIARALVNDPDIILADEPTSALDSKTADEIMGILQMLNKNGKTVIVITHDQNVANKMDRIVHIVDGKIII